MKRATKTQIHVENNELVSFNLGADYYAEHEFGLKMMKRMFGVVGTQEKKGIFKHLSPSPIIGVESRRVHHIPEILVFREYRSMKKAHAVLCCSYQESFDIKNAVNVNEIKNALPMNVYFLADKDEYASAWDDRTFCIMARGKEAVVRLKELYEAFLRLDVAIGTDGSGSIFSNAGLMFAVISKMPKEIIDQVYQTDYAHYELKNEMAKTGIEKKLKKAGKDYFALVPEWRNDDKKELVFLLNPEDQEKYNFGRFTKKELLLWIKEKGPIIKKNDRGKKSNE